MYVFIRRLLPRKKSRQTITHVRLLRLSKTHFYYINIESRIDTFLYNLIRNVEHHYESSSCNNFNLILEADAGVFIGLSQSLNLSDSPPSQFKFECFDRKSPMKPLKPPFQVATKL